MYCTISPSSDRKYILMKYNGAINAEMALKPIIEGHTLGNHLNIQRYLIDVTNASNAEAVLDSCQFAYRKMQPVNEIDKSAVVAVVAKPYDHADGVHGTTFITSDLNVALFCDIDVALQHLLNT